MPFLPVSLSLSIHIKTIDWTYQVYRQRDFTFFFFQPKIHFSIHSYISSNLILCWNQSSNTYSFSHSQNSNLRQHRLILNLIRHFNYLQKKSFIEFDITSQQNISDVGRYINQIQSHPQHSISEKPYDQNWLVHISFFFFYKHSICFTWWK